MSEAAANEAGGLQRVLGVPALFATAYGDVGSSIYYALGLVAASALGLTPIVFLISGVIFAFTAMTYAEGTASFPEAGGASSFARHAFNEFVSFGAAWAQILNYLITVAISAFFVPHYLATFWAPLSGHHGSHWDVYAAMILIGLLCLLNVVGVRETAALNIVLALMDYVTQLILVLIGIFLVLSPHTLIHNVNWGHAPTATHFLTAIAVAMIAYTGMETISNLAEETRDPARSVPRAMMYVVLAVMAIYATLPAVTLSVFPVHHTLHHGYVTALGTTYAGDPILGLVKNLPIHVELIKHIMEVFVSILAATILLIASNAGVIGISRLSYSMAQHRQVPETLRRLHPRYLTPWFAIIGAGTISCIVLLPGLANAHASTDEANLLGNLYAFGAMLSFSIAHIAVIGLRAKGTDLQWTAPLNVNLRGRRWPVFAFLGLAGTGFAWACQLVLHPTERWIGLGWVAAGLVIYTFYRRAQGLSLTKTVRAETVVQPVRDPAVAYRSVLVPVIGRLNPAAFSAAARLAEASRSTIYVLAPLEVPLSLPLTAVLPEREAALDHELDRAVALGEQLGVRVVTRLLRTRSAIQTVLAEADLREAQIMVLGHEPSRFVHHRFRLLPNTLDRIVRRARTRVLLVTSRVRDPRWT